MHPWARWSSRREATRRPARRASPLTSGSCKTCAASKCTRSATCATMHVCFASVCACVRVYRVHGCRPCGVSMPRAQRHACLRIQASGRVGAHRGGDGRQGAATCGERRPQERQADQPGQVVRGTCTFLKSHFSCTVVHCSCTLQRPAFSTGTSCRWRRYLPRLKGLKSDYSNAPATDDE